MYFDILITQEPNEDGSIETIYKKVVVAPDYPDIAPSDMKTSNQIKAGAQLEVVKNLSKGDKLRKSDGAESSLISTLKEMPDKVSDPTPTSDPTPSSDPTPQE